MDGTLIQFVQTVVLPNYWAAPNGRGVRHFLDVLASARRLVGRELDNREYLAVALHDIGVGRAGLPVLESREKHPELALVAIDEDEALAPIRHLVDDGIRQAIRYHMADDYKACVILSPLHALLVEADEGCPVWGDSRIEKPVKYWLSGRNKKFPPDTPKTEVVPYILGRLRLKVDTFKSGAVPFTPRFCSVFADEIAQASAWVTAIGETEVLECIERLAPGHP